MSNQTRDEIIKKIKDSDQRMWELRLRLLEISTNTLLKQFLPDEYKECDFAVSLTAAVGEASVLSYTCLDPNCHEFDYGSFQLSYTGLCLADEVELVGSSYADDERDLVERAIKHIAKVLHVRRIIYTYPTNDDGDLGSFRKPVESFMEFLEVRQEVGSPFAHDVFIYEVPV